MSLLTKLINFFKKLFGKSEPVKTVKTEPAKVQSTQTTQKVEKPYKYMSQEVKDFMVCRFDEEEKARILKEVEEHEAQKIAEYDINTSRGNFHVQYGQFIQTTGFPVKTQDVPKNAVPNYKYMSHEVKDFMVCRMDEEEKARVFKEIAEHEAKGIPEYDILTSYGNFHVQYGQFVQTSAFK